jgi:hypothetical protein
MANSIKARIAAAVALSTLVVYCPPAFAQAAGPQTSAAKTSGAQPAGSGTQSWTGTLFDTTRTGCGGETRGSAPGETCPVSICTLSFGIRLPDGKLYKFDEGGNTKAVYALQKSKKASKQVFSYWQTGKASKAVVAQVTGSMTSDTLNLESIRID